jgi:hypothetical protein
MAAVRRICTPCKAAGLRVAAIKPCDDEMYQTFTKISGITEFPMDTRIHNEQTGK